MVVNDMSNYGSTDNNHASCRDSSNSSMCIAAAVLEYIAVDKNR